MDAIVTRARTRTVEDITVSFIVRHMGKIYLGLALLSAVVVMNR